MKYPAKCLPVYICFLFCQYNVLAQDKLPIKFGKVSLEDFNVFFEKNTAIVRHAIKGTSIDKDGKQSPLHIGLLQVWVKQKRQWKLTARQAVKL